jgi:hypothetical protein
LTVQRLGAMLAPVTFLMADGRQVSMHIAPCRMSRDGSAPGILRRLGGEWPCVPFGYSSLPTDGPKLGARMEPPEPDEETMATAPTILDLARQ